MALDVSNPVISIIIPCLGHAELLPNCLEALSNQKFDHPYEIIVVDSASDQAVQGVVENFPAVKIFRSSKKIFPGEAKNLGASHALAPYLAFTDADCIPIELWISSVYKALQDGILMVGGPVVNAWPDKPIAVTDNLLQFADFPLRRPAGPIQHVPGCNQAIHKLTFQEAGGFSQNPVGEDVLLTSTVRQVHPLKIHFVPEMIVAHTGRNTIKEFWHHQYDFGFARGRLGLLISLNTQHLGKNVIFVPFFFTKRLSYIFLRISQWSFNLLGKYLFLTPLILIGLLAWSFGFWKGCQFSMTGIES